MADIRINALATTASSTASDDYLAVDGTTNGTRKLSAYSPTFGGNLTVSGGTVTSGTGTLTLNSSANTVVLQSAGTTALTLSTSQNATFAGQVGCTALKTGFINDATNSVSAITIADTSGNVTFVGNIKTAAPSGGTAGAWKLGVRVAATTTLDTTQYLQVDIGGTLYKVALVTS